MAAEVPRRHSRWEKILVDRTANSLYWRGHTQFAKEIRDLSRQLESTLFSAPCRNSPRRRTESLAHVEEPNEAKQLRLEPQLKPSDQGAATIEGTNRRGGFGVGIRNVSRAPY